VRPCDSAWAAARHRYRLAAHLKNVKTVTPTNDEKAKALVAAQGKKEAEVFLKRDRRTAHLERDPVKAQWRPTHFD